MNRTLKTLAPIDLGIRPNGTGARQWMRVVVLGMALWPAAFCPGPGGCAIGQVLHYEPNVLDRAMQERVQAALVRIKASSADISAVETLLAIEPGVVEAVGTNKLFSSFDPLRAEALRWRQSLQPVEVLKTCLEKGSNAAVHWALRQIVWRKSNGGFDEQSMARLMPGVERALVGPPPLTRAQAVRTMLVCLPLKQRQGFLKGLLKGQPDEVIAQSVQAFANDLRQSDPDVEAIVTQWLKASDDPLLLGACCTYWWLVKSRSASEVKEDEIAAFERLAAHQDPSVRHFVTLAVEGVATPARPRLVTLLVQLTHDQDSSVNWQAARALRNANTPEVNARLRELFEIQEPENLRSAAIEVLGIFGKDNLPLLLGAAKADKKPSVRQHALYALRQIGTPEAGQGLESALQDPDEGVRREAKTQLKWFQTEHPPRQ